MNARHAARQLALMILFQQDRNINLENLSAAVDQLDSTEVITEFCRTLTRNALATLEESGTQLATTIDMLNDIPLKAEANLNLPIDAPLKPVTLPTTEAIAEQLKATLNAIEHGYEALQLPEFLILAKDSDVEGYAKRLVMTVNDHLAAIDETITQNSDDWKLPRMTRMDRSILRLTTGEMMAIDSIDHSVSIDEAIELAKQYSDERSYQLINGILGGVAHTLQARAKASV